MRSSNGRPAVNMYEESPILDATRDGDLGIRGGPNRRSDRRELLERGDGGNTSLPQVIVDPSKPQLTTPSTPGFDGEERSLLSNRKLDSQDLELDITVEKPAPPDRYNGVYFILLIHGVGTLMPWNMFITARDYFVDYKLGGSDTEYGSNFLAYLGICSQVPNLILSLVNLFIQIRGSLTSRIVCCLVINSAIFVLTVALAMINSQSWPLEFFIITMITVVILNSANGIYQNSVFGLASDFPMEYSNAVVLGTNISGTFVAVLGILTKSISTDLKMAAIWYFIGALFVLLVCFDTYFMLPFMKYYRHFHEEGMRKREIEARQSVPNSRKQSRGCLSYIINTARPYLHVIGEAWIQMFNVFFVFFVTLTIFPAIMADIKPLDPNFVIPKGYFTDITCFLFFNAFAMIGNVIAHHVQFPNARWLWLPVLLRGLMIPYFMFCNFRPTTRTFPVYIDNDWAYIFMGILMSFTSGYFSSLCMMYAPRVVSGDKARVAGMMAAFFLILGIVAGVNFTLFVAYINGNLGPLTPLAAQLAANLTTTAVPATF